MNMHKGTTQCPVCHKVLSRTTHMKRHLKNRHGWLGVGTTAAAAAAAVANAAAAAAAVAGTATATTVPGVPVVTAISGAASGKDSSTTTSTPTPISVSSTAIAHQNAASIESNATYTTIRIRESSVERITSSPIP